MYITYLILSLAFLLFAYLVFRIIIKRDYEKHLRLSPVSYLLEIFTFALHVNMFYFTVPSPWPYLPKLSENSLLIVASSLLFGIGLILLLISWFNLGSRPSLGVDRNKLKTTGLYNYSRNPQLIGYGLMLISFGVMFFSWLTINWLLLYLIAAYFMIKSEEEFLKNNYKEEYLSYCRKVPRVLKL